VHSISFAQVPSAITPPAISYPTPKSYVINNPITPLSPTNTGGAVPATIYGQVSTVAGNFNIVTGVAVDASGNIYVEDYGNNQIKKITTGGTISVFAGNGSSGLINGPGSIASFNDPDGLVADAAGNIYVGDEANNVIRKITPAGSVVTLAGNGSAGSADGTGTAASFYFPRGLAVDATGNVYVADQVNNLIRKVTALGVVTTIAGNTVGGFADGTGTAASFNSPMGVGLDLAGNLYVADAGNNAIRKITPAGVVSTFAKGLNYPREIRVDGTGNFYETDENSNTIKRISSGGIVTTLAGTGQTGNTDGAFNMAKFNQPIGLILDGAGNLIIGDAFNNSVRKIVITGYTIDKALPSGLTFDQTTGIISGTPTALSAATNYTITAYNGGGSSSAIVSLAVTSPIQSVIVFPPPVTYTIGPDGILHTGATSNNNETPITYTSSDPTVAYVGTDGQIHVIAPGTTTITAYQAGDANYTAATPVAEVYNFIEYQQILFPPIAAKTTCDADFDPGIQSATNVIPVTYASSNTAVATINASGIIHIVGAGTTTITASQAGNALYYPATPQSQVLTVNLPVTPLVTIVPNLSAVCAGTVVTFTATVSNVNTGLTYQWQVNGINVGTNSPTYTTTPQLSTDVYQCLVTNTNSCNAVGTSNSYNSLTVNPYLTPSITITSVPAAAVCTGASFTFTAAVTNGGTNPSYQWLVNGLVAGANSNTFTANNFANGDVVTCIFTNTTSPCLTVATATSNAIKTSVTSPPNIQPSVTVSEYDPFPYEGTIITFTAIPANASTVTSYQWQVNGANVGTNSNTYTSTKLKNGDVVTCTIISSIACSLPATSSPITLTILPVLDIKIPNTFTPNGDGINDYWDIPALASYPNCVVSIFDRAGSLLFQSRGYPIPWDGTYKGKPVPFATYYYVIETGAPVQRLSGSVTVIR
jgi:gliding motility-associated-like protein